MEDLEKPDFRRTYTEGTPLNNRYKIIYISVHECISVSKLAIHIIDTPQFQRLRQLKQLGTCSYVYPGGVHTRFEHSLGVYNLTGKLLETIKRNSNSEELDKCVSKIDELSAHGKFTDSVIELVKIAGLCHDLGHGPFSHLFDDVFITKKGRPGEKHEVRSGLLLEMIIKENKLPITAREIQFIKNVIHPRKENTGFLYQIVANNINGVDVDKYDYIARDTAHIGLKYGISWSRLMEDVIVANDNICYPYQMASELSNLFSTRYRLHKEIYTHKAVIAIQWMWYDIMKKLDKEFKLDESVENMKEFCKLTDGSLATFVDLSKDTSCAELYNRIVTRRLYKLIGTKTEKIVYGEKYKTDDLITKICDKDSKIDRNSIIVNKFKIGYIGGNNKHPVDNIIFYKKDKETGEITISTEKHKNISELIPDIYQEYVTMVYSRSLGKEMINLTKKALNSL